MKELLTRRHVFITADTSSSVSSLRAMSSTTPSISEFGIAASGNKQVATRSRDARPLDSEH